MASASASLDPLDEDWLPSEPGSESATSPMFFKRHDSLDARQIDSSPDNSLTDMAHISHPVNTHVAPIVINAPPVKLVTAAPSESDDGCAIGFIGLFFSTFFGGHTADWASPKDQYTYFRDFGMWINS